MATLNIFQQYSQGENTVTNNVLLMLSFLYDVSPKYYEEYVNGLIDETELYQIIPTFSQQFGNNGNGIIDGHISIRPSTIIIETKLHGLEWIDKLLKYTESFRKDETKLLFHLSTATYDDKMKKQIGDRLAANENNKSIKFFSLTYQQLVEQLKSLQSLYHYEPQIRKLSIGFEDYCQNMGLLPANQHILRAMACGQSFSLNVRHKFYFDLASRGYSYFKYLGIYKDKAVRYIGTVENMIEADWDEANGLVIKDSTHLVTENQKKRLIAAIKDTLEEDWGIDKNHRFFLLDNFYETYFEKTSPGGIFRVRYFDIEDYFDVKEPVTVEKIAENLRGASWE